MTQAAELLRELFDAAVDAVAGQSATRRALQEPQIAARLAGHDIYLVAVGKAADAMTQGALEVLGERLRKGLVVTKHDHLSTALEADTRLECHEAGHPQPDQASLNAGAALVSFIRDLPDDARLVFMVSGGASALVEHLVGSSTLDDLRSLTSRLLAEGYPIGQMNQVRRNLSRIKGGRLAAFLPAVETVQLLISDVPGDVPGDIGSGLLIPPEPATAAIETLCDDLLEPRWLEESVTPPPPEHGCWRRVHTQIIASSSIAQQAVVAAATRLALKIVRDGGLLDGDMPEVTDRLADELLASDAADGLYVWGGEPTVRLPAEPGRGGRNQHLALALAARFAQVHGEREVSVLVCGTDGTDGPTDDAGGLVDTATLARGQAAGLAADEYLRRADAGTYLERTLALVTTGPTGTNVMDLALAWVGPAPSGDRNTG